MAKKQQRRQPSQAEPERRSGGRLMYTPHPPASRLQAILPARLIDAARRTLHLPFSQVVGMRVVADELAQTIARCNPHAVLFFATGGIPVGMAALHRLEALGRFDLLGGQRFHLFPGLSWRRMIDELSPGAYFVREALPLVTAALGTHSDVQLLAFDTTNTGNAVNRILKVFSDLRAQIPEDGRNRLRLTVIGIVNGERARQRKRGATDLKVGTPSGDVYLLPPKHYRPTGPLSDRAVVPFLHRDDGAIPTLSVSYWITEAIPTEDRAELLGARMLREDERVVETVAEPGRIELQFSNGRTSLSTGLDALGRRFGTLLRLAEDSLQWQRLLACETQPPAGADEQDAKQEADILKLGVMWLFEANHTDTAQVMAVLEEEPRLRGFQIHWLAEQDEVPDSLVRKAILSAREDPEDCGPEAIRLFSQVFTDIAEREWEVRLAWWLKQLESTAEGGEEGASVCPGPPE